MLNRITLLLFFVFILAGGALSPPVAIAQDYLLFAADMQGTRGLVYGMDGEGNISLREQMTVCLEGPNITASPDGRMVIFSRWLFSPCMSIFFIGNDGSLSPPLYEDNPTSYCQSDQLFNPVAFHPTLPLFYVGYNPISIYRYSSKERWVELTSSTLMVEPQSFPSYNLGYSPWSNSLVYLKAANADYSVQSVKINADGSFGSLNPALAAPPMPTYGDFVIAPNGRWTAGTSIFDIFLAKINQDGSFTQVEPFPDPYSDEPEIWGFQSLTFTPDSRRLLMVSGAHVNTLVLYDINQQTGELTRRGELSSYTPGWDMSRLLPLYVAVTPDGRFAVFRSAHPTINGYNLLYVVRIHDDGYLEYLPSKQVVVDHYISKMLFVRMPHSAAKDWMMYE